MRRNDEQPLRAEVRWTLGCLVGTAAMIGTLILVLLVAIALRPPVWVQVALGVGLAIGGGALTWLVVAALGQARAAREDTGPHSVPPSGRT
ncbi:MAG TPA: hypothetical protein VG408_08695 [Actinomycetota bacterium]|nr:hypothetical protein [Actinomycetota bacterium]